MAPVLSLEHSLFTLMNANSSSTPANCKEGICLLTLLQSWKSQGTGIYMKTILPILAQWAISADAYMAAYTGNKQTLMMLLKPVIPIVKVVLRRFFSVLRTSLCCRSGGNIDRCSPPVDICTRKWFQLFP